MVDGAQPDMISGLMTVTQSRTSWGIEVGRHRLSVTRTREARTIGGIDDGLRPRAAVKPVWPIAIGAFASVSAFGLFVVGAIASEPLIPRQYARYSLSMPVPARATKIVRGSSYHGARKSQTAGTRGDGLVLPNLSGPRFDTADEPYVVRAMRAGEFQEWLGADGQRRFLNAGPEQVDGDQRCRDLALLVRYSDGSSRTRAARRCAPVRPSDQMATAPAETVSAYHAPLASDTIELSSPMGDTRLASDTSYGNASEMNEAMVSGR